jgi:hypothetical protein
MNSVEYVERGDNTPLTWGLVIVVGLRNYNVLDQVEGWSGGEDSDVHDLC